MDTPPDLLTAAAAIRPGQKVLFYDGQCRWCCRLSQSSAPALLTRGIHIAPFPAGLDAEEVKLVRASGVITGGADAVLDILAEWPVLRPLARLGNRPRIHALLTKLYRKVAVSRHCLNGACAINARPPFSVRVIDTVIRLFAEAMSRIYPPERESGAAPS